MASHQTSTAHYNTTVVREGGEGDCDRDHEGMAAQRHPKGSDREGYGARGAGQPALSPILGTHIGIRSQLHTHTPFSRLAIAPVPALAQGLAIWQSEQYQIAPFHGLEGSPEKVVVGGMKPLAAFNVIGTPLERYSVPAELTSIMGKYLFVARVALPLTGVVLKSELTALSLVTQFPLDT